jgi:hypothetical protein
MCYEFGCAGLANSGTPAAHITASFPEFKTTCFNADGSWDYSGSNPRETEDEVRTRVTKIVSWIWEVAQSLSQRQSPRPKVLVLALHQTIADLICQVLVDGTSSEWAYAEPKYKLHNTGMTELSLECDGHAKVVFQNDHKHLKDVIPASKHLPRSLPQRRCMSATAGATVFRCREEAKPQATKTATSGCRSRGHEVRRASHVPLPPGISHRPADSFIQLGRTGLHRTAKLPC